MRFHPYHCLQFIFRNVEKETKPTSSIFIHSFSNSKENKTYFHILLVTTYTIKFEIRGMILAEKNHTTRFVEKNIKCHDHAAVWN